LTNIPLNTNKKIQKRPAFIQQSLVAAKDYRYSYKGSYWHS